MTRDDVILEGGPLSGYRVPTERVDGGIKPLMAFPVHNGPQAETAVYVHTGKKRIEFVRDVPIYEYIDPSPGA